MTIPTNLRVPFVYVEFDPTRAFQGPAILEYQVLLIGQRTSAGSKSQAQIDQLFSADEAMDYYGPGSSLHRMAKGFFANNKVTGVFGASLDDDVGGVAATGTYAITGTASADGTIYATVAGTLITAAVASGDTATDAGDALETAINADTSLPVTAVNATGTVTLTAKNKGECGNDIDLRLNLNPGELTPAGLTIVVTGMASGATNPDIQDIIDILGDAWYQVIGSTFTDATNLTAIETELTDRFGPIRMIDGVYVTVKTGTVGALGTFGNGRNSPYVSCADATGYPAMGADVVGAIAGKVAAEGMVDPARPFQTLELVGILPPPIVERRTLVENNTLLYDGISTLYVDSGGKVRIQRMITMYQKNAQGAADIAYLDVNTMLTLMYIRYDWRNSILTKYPRAKLADDGVNVQSGQSVMTPKVGKAEAIARARQWEFQGLVENVDQFKNDLIVERSQTDPNRLDFILPPDLINQFRVGGTTIQFLLQSPAV
jgi:phage tail sheath gpL-like